MVHIAISENGYILDLLNNRFSLYKTTTKFISTTRKLQMRLTSESEHTCMRTLFVSIKALNSMDQIIINGIARRCLLVYLYCINIFSVRNDF